jgi:hypothetical protein
MARKKIEPITSLGNGDKLTVQKSLPLFSLWRSELTLAEFKILDTYLSRIDSHKPEKRAIMFEKGELEKILGVKKINNQDLKTRLIHLMGNVIEVPDDSIKQGFKLVTLFEEAIAEQDDYGVWQVKLECTQKAMKYFFNIENLGYLRYKLRCITSLTSRYTYIMFIYLEKNRYRKSWDVPLDELKQILDCDKEELYKEYKFFNQKILKRVQKEMHEKTECKYTYEPIKKGRTVVGIRFEVETLPKLEAEVPEAPMAEDPSRPLWESALEDWKLSTEQIDELAALVAMVPSHKLPECQKEDIEKARYQYIAQKAAEIKRRNEEKRIRSRFSYLRKLMQDDIASKPQEAPQAAQAASRGTQAFRNFTERTDNHYMEKIMERYKQH